MQCDELAGQAAPGRWLTRSLEVKLSHKLSSPATGQTSSLTEYPQRSMKVDIAAICYFASDAASRWILVLVKMQKEYLSHVELFDNFF
jgi:hypothetical protein